jgi:parvulin-like peptidyl-prolyl isomerase
MPRHLAFQPADVITHLRRTRGLREVAVGMAVDAVLTETARAWGVSVTDTQLQQAANRFRAANGLSDPAATRAWLAAADWSRSDFEEFLEREVLAGLLPAKLFAEQGAAYFAERQADFARVRFRRLTAATDAAAKEALAQVTEDGRDFAALAGASDVVEYFRGTLLPAVAERLFAAAPGAVVGPVAVTNGFNLYQVVEVLPADLAEPAIAAEVGRQLFEAWVNAQLADTQVDLAGLRPSLTAPVSLGAPVKLS